MAFTLPDNDEAFNANQAIWMQTDINAIAAGIGGDGVLSGCAVTAQGSPDMTLAVAVGVVILAGVTVAVTAGNVTITTADATNPRIDLVVVSNAGAKSVTAGTAAANPKAPDIPATSVLLAMAYVPANDTAIASNQITDKRTILPVVPPVRGGAIAEGRTQFVAGAIYNTVPGIDFISAGTLAVVANQTRYFPMLVTTPITLDQLSCEVTSAGAASTTARLAIYEADTLWQPGTLVLDAGTVVTDSTGIKTISISQALPAGRYLLAFNPTGVPTMRSLRGGAKFFGTSWSANPFNGAMRVNATLGTYPTPGTAWTTSNISATPTDYLVTVRVLTP